MNILAIGDIVGNSGVDYASAKIKKVCGEHNIDFVIVNGENSAVGNGITREAVQKIFNSGADVITLGNHAFSKKTS